MDGTYAQVIYLLLVGVAVVGALILQSRGRRGQAAQHIAIWGLIFMGTLAGYGLWSDISRQVLPREASFGPNDTVTIPRSQDGHYHLTLKIGGVPVGFMVDTGASDLVLTPEDARRVGIDPANLAFAGRATTANGLVATARVVLHDVALGPIVVPRLQAEVNQAPMPSSLLGMSYLQRFGKIVISGDQMTLSP